MNKRKFWLTDFLSRYLILIFFSLFGTTIFYFIFKTPTVYSSFFVLKLFYDVNLISPTIISFASSQLKLEIIGACIAGSAYFLLLILNLTTPNIKLKKRLYMLLISFGIFFIINVLRIFLVGLLYANNSSSANILHEFFWYFGSIIFVVLIWFAEVKIFKIKDIPFYSDIRIFIKKYF